MYSSTPHVYSTQQFRNFVFSSASPTASASEPGRHGRAPAHSGPTGGMRLMYPVPTTSLHVPLLLRAITQNASS
jgi:hypothetical protein